MQRLAKIVIFGTGLISLAMILLHGCSTLRSRAGSSAGLLQTGIGKYTKITDDVLFFRDLQQIDLNNDGEKDIVAVYSTPDNLNGFKIILVHGGKGTVAFQKLFGESIIFPR